MSSNTTIDYNYYLKLDEWEEKEVISLMYCGSHHLPGWLESARKSGKIKPREEANARFKMMIEIVPSWTSGIPAERYYDETGTGYYYDPFTVLDWAVKKEITLPKALQDWYDLQNQARNSSLITDVTNDLTDTQLNQSGESNDISAYLDKKHPMFSEELSIAIEAWYAVLECNPDKPNRGSRKKLISNWLETHHSTLTTEAKSRITTLLNPDKNGGAPSPE